MATVEERGKFCKIKITQWFGGLKTLGWVIEIELPICIYSHKSIYSVLNSQIIPVFILRFNPPIWPHLGVVHI